MAGFEGQNQKIIIRFLVGIGKEWLRGEAFGYMWWVPVLLGPYVNFEVHYFWKLAI
jgi:hypothetical protein